MFTVKHFAQASLPPPPPALPHTFSQENMFNLTGGEQVRRICILLQRDAQRFRHSVFVNILLNPSNLLLRGFFFFSATLMNVFFFSHKWIAHIAEEECLISTITCSFQVRRGRVGGFIPSHIQSR